MESKFPLPPPPPSYPVDSVAYIEDIIDLRNRVYHVGCFSV